MANWQCPRSIRYHSNHNALSDPTTMLPKPIACLALAAPALLLFTDAHAVQWQSVRKKTDVQVEYDKASLLRPAKDTVRVWARTTYTNPQLLDSGAFTFRRQLVLLEFDCVKRQFAISSTRYEAADGSLLSSETRDGNDFAAVAPESNVESILRAVCAPPPKPAEPPPPPPPPPPPEEPKEPVKKGKKTAPPPPPPPPPAWSYSGESGPVRWGSLSHLYAACSLGQQQSPIDLRKTVHADLPDIEFAYAPTALRIEDTGHTVKVDTQSAGHMVIEGARYELKSLHFHRPSEEKIDGKAYAMSVHLVHQDQEGRLAVVAVLIEAGKKEHPLIRTLWNNLPLEKGKAVSPAEVRIDPSLILPKKRTYYTFMGSLTTPPCTEGVRWLVLKTPIQLSKEQLAGFATLYKNNARPTQPTNGRAIKESR